MRFTKKSDKLGYCLRHSSIKTWQCWNKLGQLEDIEDELGIDLITLFKAIKNGVFYYSEGIQLTKGIVYIISNYLGTYNDKLSYSFLTYNEKQQLFFADYGKTWALTKEELSNGNS